MFIGSLECGGEGGGGGGGGGGNFFFFKNLTFVCPYLF